LEIVDMKGRKELGVKEKPCMEIRGEKRNVADSLASVASVTEPIRWAVLIESAA
jgi:hypothetical protein